MKKKLNEWYGRIIPSSKLEDKITACFWSGLGSLFCGWCTYHALKDASYIWACVLLFFTACFGVWFVKHLIK